MRTQAWMILGFSTLVTGLVGCHGDNSSGTPVSSVNAAEQSPPTPASTDFSSYAQLLVSTYTCDTNPPAETNGIDFTFVASADTALPVDTSNDAGACTV